MIFSTFNCKHLYLTIPIVCRKNLSQSHCKIITIEGKEIFFLWGARIIVNALKFNRN
jgi:hypothetical protein